ncbi:putative nucleotidyltransferase substrate binding domain-containing protein, partial [Ideonella sp.]|uniref:putative nucleotidyltransferase substrate binding domain-containing protein n=1 Tax=Ideonella sp. TaxID=1929293 RepID=UPI003BB540BF
LQSLTMARVDQGVLRPAHVVSAEADVVSVVRLFAEARISAVLVREPASGAAEDDATTLGIFTTTGLQRAVLSGLPLASTPVRQWTSRPLVTVQASDPLYGALATMIRHRVQRVVVAQDTRVLGMLEQVDLLSALSNHSWLITRQIIEATELDTLAQASAQITKVIGLLHRGGTKVSLIARLVRELNAQLFERTWQLVAPADLVAHSCLFVMGSEGRGEQLLKTDQDNALVLSDGFEPPADLAAICAAFSAALTRFGYPECPGKIMVSNPAWCMPAAAFAEAARGWLLQPSAESLISLAIFMDAQPVAGDATLLAGVQATVRALVNDNDALLARFAASVSAFESSPGWWNRLLAGDEAAAPLDLKKAGTFPLVHGVRSLALAHRIHATSTTERIEALVAADALSREMATDLQDCLHFFMGLKLKLGLAALDAGQLPDNGVVRERLSSLDRDLLKDTLAVVKRFKLLLRQRFHLDLL